MPSLFAASMTVLPCGTCTARPSISMLMGGGELIRNDSYVILDETVLVLDVIFELAAEMLDEALHRQRRCIAQRTDRPALDVVGDGRQHVEVLEASGTMLDPIDHSPQPPGALATRRALAARLLEVEVRQAQQALHHAARVVEHDDGTG